MIMKVPKMSKADKDANWKKGKKPTAIPRDAATARMVTRATTTPLVKNTRKAVDASTAPAVTYAAFHTLGSNSSAL
jgi:hypothetical protein